MLSERLTKYLVESGVKYEVLRHGEAYTAQEVAAAMHVHGRMLVKVVIVKSEKGFMMVAVPADRKVDISTLRSELGLHFATLATESEFSKLFPDCEPGAMPPFGNLYGIPVYVDKKLAEDEKIVFQGGTHYEAVKMRYDDFERLVEPRYLEASRQAA